MKRAFAFAGRCLREVLRDPLSYLFCFAFPLVMLGMMTAIDSVIPPEAGMTIFKIRNLTPAIAVFALSFVMLLATLSVSKDRSSAFLLRLCSSPMRPAEFVAGYILPLLLVSAGEAVVTYLAGGVIGAVMGERLLIGNALLSILSLIPCAVLFIALGVLFGALLGEKAAPPCCSILISLCGVLGGIWFDSSVFPEGNFFGVLCRILPFENAVEVARAALAGQAIPGGALLNCTLWALGAFCLSSLVFRLRLRADLC